MTTLDQLLNDYLEYRRGLNYSERSLEEYRYDCGKFLRYLAETFRVRLAGELRKNHLFAWQKHLAGRRNSSGRPLAARTLNKNISGVRNFLEFLAKRGFILAETAETLKPVKQPVFLPLEALPHGKIRKILRKIDTATPKGYRDRTILEVLYSTGVRASELCGIEVKDVDLANSLIRVFGKGRKERLVPLGRTALRCLETYLNGVRAFLVVEESGGAVFLNNAGTPMKRYTLLKLVHRYFDGTEEFSVSPHTFRRSCATEMIRSNANLYHVKELLGHETLTTVRHYAKLTINDLRKTHAKCHPRERDET